jgi:hypothetical protein
MSKTSKYLYDSQRRVYRRTTAPECGESVFTVKFMRSHNFAYERIFFLESQSITLYTDKNCCHEDCVLVIQAYTLSKSQRSATVHALVLAADKTN